MTNYPPPNHEWPGDDAYRGTYAPVPPPPKKKPPVWLWVIFALALTVAIVLCAAFLGRDQAKQGEPKDVVTTAPTRQTSKPAQAQPAAPKKPVAQAATKVGDGTFIIGKDVAAGRYKTTGASEGLIQFCTWSTSKTDSFRDIIDFGSASEVSQPGYVTLKKGLYFKTAGCAPWVRQ